MLTYWSELQGHQARELETQMLLHKIPTGKVVAKTGDVCTEDEAKALIDDPLINFPNDVDYDAITTDFVEKNWEADRVEAFASDDPLAKRCSVNLKLWEMYAHLKEFGQATEVMVKRLIREDIAFAAFFPDEMDLARYANKKGEHLADTSSTETGEVLDEHLAHLFNTGELSKLLKKFSCDGKVAFPKEILR